MNKIDDGGNAFPGETLWQFGEDGDPEDAKAEWTPVPDKGMSLRMWFAGMAMQAIMSDKGLMSELLRQTDDANHKCRAVAVHSLQYADAMIAASKESSDG